jgi:ABC-type oligopeptide transport system ATPase subunit
MMNPQQLVSVKNVTKIFYTKSGSILKRKTPFKAVDDVSLEIYKGECLALIGHSGSGKTTLGRCISGIYQPDSGDIYYNGEALFAALRKRNSVVRRKIQMIFQHPAQSLNPRQTVQKCVAEPLKIHEGLTGKKLIDKVNELIFQVGLTPNLLQKYPHQLSGGQQQRLAIARVLTLKPELLIADEPTASLDALHKYQIVELLNTLKHQYDLTLLFITHDLSVLPFLCDRVAVMAAGKVVEIDSLKNVLQNPQNNITRQLITTSPLQAELVNYSSKKVEFLKHISSGPSMVQNANVICKPQMAAKPKEVK